MADQGTPTRAASSPQPRVRSRTQSISSDRPSTVGYNMMPPQSVSPNAAFIAAAAASQIVTSDHDSHANTWYDLHGIEPSSEAALVSHAALQLVNSFLDQLLFRFLSLARSTSLHALRPAVTETLKPKLAKDAINQADEELREYLGGGDDEDMLQSQTPEASTDWDLELVWKRTRLRCMVYSSLGDMEEEDEDFYADQENLGNGEDALNETVSPAVAIFLTSILEFMGEQTLISAGQAAFHRMRFLHEKESGRSATPAPLSVASRVTVEEVDMERVAFDRTLGRLWRAWKKRVRSPGVDGGPVLPRSFSGELSGYNSRPTSSQQMLPDDSTIAEVLSESNESSDGRGVSAANEAAAPEEPQESSSDAPDTATPVAKNRSASVALLDIAAATPLPESENDVLEILIPDIGYFSDEDEEEKPSAGKSNKATAAHARRPKSLMIFSHGTVACLPTPTVSEPRTPDTPVTRKRANSLPTPSLSPFSTPKAKRVKPSKEDEAQTKAVEVQLPPEPEPEQDSKPVPSAESKPAQPVEPAAPVESTEAPKKEVDASMAATVPPRASTRPKRSPPVSLQTRVIGAAITTTLPRAIPLSSIKTDMLNEDDIDEFTEEPEILTSSRISLSGRSGSRSNSPTVSEITRSGSVSSVRPGRSPSVHSLRLIEVAAVPRSPVTRSQRSSVDIHDINRANNVSRASTISTQAIAEEVVQPSASDGTSGGAAGRAKVSSRPRTSESISETEHEHAMAAPTPPRKAPGAPSAAPKEEAPAEIPTALPASHTTTRQYTPSSPVHPGVPEDKPEVPPKPSAAELPLPPRSPRRPGSSGSGARAAVAAVGGAVAVAGAAAMSTLPIRTKVQKEAKRAEAQVDVQTVQTVQTEEHTETETTPRPHKPGSVSSAASTTSSNRLRPVRTSEESTVMRPEDVARNFEQLIQSDETIQYTLTPENMRSIDPSRATTDASSIVVRSRKSDDARSRSSSINRAAADARAAATQEALAPAVPPVSAVSAKPSGPVPRSSFSSMMPSSASILSSRSRNGGPQARDARVPRESLADLAEFIRSTGPASSRAGAAPAVVGGTPTSRSGSSITSGLRSASGPTILSKSRSKSSLDSGNVSSMSSPHRPKYQAREPTVNYKDDNSDLIDFIRRGPPNAGGGPRIPRTIAPFRTTMDSDQMSGAVGGRAVDATIGGNVRYSAASTNVTESSAGSATGLLKKDKRLAQKTGSGTPGSGSGSGSVNYTTFGGGRGGGPVRKSRAPRDPYAIDMSDDDGDGDDYGEEAFGGITPTGRENRRPAGMASSREESLMDFLNSVPPPSEPTPVLFDIPQTRQIQQQLAQQQQQLQQQQAAATPKKKGSASSLMSRFRRDVSNSMSSATRLNRAHTMTNVSTAAAAAAAASGSPGSPSSRTASILSGRSGSKGNHHTPIQVNMNMPPLPPLPVGNNNNHGNGGSSSSRPTTSATTGTGRMSMRSKYEPREAQPVPSRSTRDLAEFFRSSGPPQPART